MSWLARSLANSLKLENNDEQEPVHEQIVESPGRGVKEDLSELTKTFSRQLWGVASFLAPPPSENPNSSSISDPSQNPSTEPSISSRNTSETDSDVEKVAEPIISGSEAQDLPRMAGIRNDFAEIGGKFKTGLSRFSTNKAVSEISKLASSFLPFVSEEENLEENLGDRGGLGEKSSGGAVGVTEEVLAFARNISMHPETWLDFPLFPDDEDADDFDMSDAQQEHALAVEHLAPRLAALRIELCPGHISEGCFWKIYFVLLHSRLNKHDAELLSTPQIVEARSMLLQDLQNRTKPGGRSANPAPLEQFSTPLASNIAADTTSLKTFSLEPRNSLPVTDPETEKHPVVTYETKMIDKSIVEEGSAIQTRSKALPSTSSEQVGPKYEEDEDDWFEEENANMGHGSAGTIPLGNEEDVSFSDLEEEDDSKPVKGSTIKGSRGWVQLSKSSGDAEGSDCPSGSTRLPRNSEIKESNDWLSVDEIDAV